MSLKKTTFYMPRPYAKLNLKLFMFIRKGLGSWSSGRTH